MTSDNDRLLSLIEYAQQAARLGRNSVSNVMQHNQVALYEHQLRDRPGISLNDQKGSDDEEVWLVVKRLQETKLTCTATIRDTATISASLKRALNLSLGRPSPLDYYLRSR